MKPWKPISQLTIFDSNRRHDVSRGQVSTADIPFNCKEFEEPPNKLKVQLELGHLNQFTSLDGFGTIASDHNGSVLFNGTIEEEYSGHTPPRRRFKVRRQ